jgi:hypothetical protein
MSNLSGSLNSLASTSIVDFYAPLMRAAASTIPGCFDCRDGSRRRWGIALIAIAFVARGWGSVFTTGLTIACWCTGRCSATFLLGAADAPRHGERGAARASPSRLPRCCSSVCSRRWRGRGTSLWDSDCLCSRYVVESRQAELKFGPTLADVETQLLVAPLQQAVRRAATLVAP